jgi:hypothetical protein
MYQSKGAWTLESKQLLFFGEREIQAYFSGTKPVDFGQFPE